MPNELAYMPFFVSDFMMAVTSWPPDRVGAYGLALFYQWEQGGLPANDERELATILHTSKPSARRLWAAIVHKFKPDEKGLWWNAKLEIVRKEARRQNALASQRGQRGAAARWGKGAHVQMPEQSTSNAQALLKQSASNGNHIQNQGTPPLPPSSEGGSRRKRGVSGLQKQTTQQRKKTTEYQRLLTAGVPPEEAHRRVFGS